MKRLILGTTIAIAAAQLAGCIITSDNDVDTGLITVEWNFKEIATGAFLSCPPGYEDAIVTAHRVDASQVDIIDAYDCVDGRGTEEYPLGVYDITLDISGTSGFYAGTPTVEVDIIGADKTVSYTIADDGGYFAFSWDLVDDATSAPLDCFEAGADTVSLIATVTGGAEAFSDPPYLCENGSAITAALPAGSYTVSIDALNGAGEAITAQAQNLTNQVINDRNEVTNLGTITLPIP